MILRNQYSPYAIGKQAIEGYLRYFKATEGLDYIVFRISNPYGERQNLTGTQGVIPIFLNQLQKNKPVTVYGDGSMIRDYIYVTDVADMIAKIFNIDHANDIYNLGSGQAISLAELMLKIQQITKQKN